MASKVTMARVCLLLPAISIGLLLTIDLHVAKAGTDTFCSRDPVCNLHVNTHSGSRRLPWTSVSYVCCYQLLTLFVRFKYPLSSNVAVNKSSGSGAEPANFDFCSPSGFTVVEGCSARVCVRIDSQLSQDVSLSLNVSGGNATPGKVDATSIHYQYQLEIR